MTITYTKVGGVSYTSQGTEMLAAGIATEAEAAFVTLVAIATGARVVTDVAHGTGYVNAYWPMPGRPHQNEHVAFVRYPAGPQPEPYQDRYEPVGRTALPVLVCEPWVCRCGAVMSLKATAADEYEGLDEHGRTHIEWYGLPDGLPDRYALEDRLVAEAAHLRAGKKRPNPGEPLPEWEIEARALMAAYSDSAGSGVMQNKWRHVHDRGCKCTAGSHGDPPACCGLPMRLRPSGWSCRARCDARKHPRRDRAATRPVPETTCRSDRSASTTSDPGGSPVPKPEPLQIFPPLEPAVEAALRASIERHGVLVPVVKDQHGRILDGHHRSRIATELGVACPTKRVTVDDEDHAFEIAGTLNMVRRHLGAEQRRMIVVDLRAQGHSQRAIAHAVGISQAQVRKDLASQLSTGAQLPERVTGLDGKSRPATRPARSVEPGDLVADDSGEVLAVIEVERDGDLAVLHAGDDQALIVDADTPVTVVPPEPPVMPQDAPAEGPAPPKRVPSKPDLGGGISHPARYPMPLLPILAAAVPPQRYARVLDPFAGTGRIHELPNHTVGVELEPEWARLAKGTMVGDALWLPFPDDTFDAVVTSPAYGNRLADHHNARDPSLRRTYTHDLGRPLHSDNSGAMAWGPRYRDFHEMAWEEIIRVLLPGGRLVLNVKDHPQRGTRMFVAAWHVHTLIDLGLELRWFDQLDTGGLGQGANTADAYPEQVFVFDKDVR